MHRVSVHQAERPRNVNAFQAAAILYGDLGTSKAYVIGLAYAFAAHSSFWLISSVSILTILVGLNYILICKYYPNGGGVYASVRSRSEVIALLGGFFLICDYILTAAISAVSAFSYLGVQSPELWSIGTILLIGCLNYFGPKHTGNLALIISLFTIAVVVTLAYFTTFFLPEAIHNVKPLTGTIREDWIQFVEVIVALSGIEAIANMTGVMQLDRGSSMSRPFVVKTATPAIIFVIIEVCFFTTLFSLAVNALPGLVVHGQEVSAPGYPNVRDSMLRYMGEVFGGMIISPEFGKVFGIVISLVFAILLLSAVNTAILGLNSLMFVMSRDKQFPEVFQKINRFGVPVVPLALSAIAPVIVLLFAHEITTLASLYAIGFVGAIMTNLGSTSTDMKLGLKSYERMFMFATFLIMAAIELTLFIEKPHARMFVISVVAAGLFLKALQQEHMRKIKYKQPERHVYVSELAKKALEPVEAVQKMPTPAAGIKYVPIPPESHLHGQGAILCAATHVGKSLEFAFNECLKANRHLFILFIREQRLIPHRDIAVADWKEDEQACIIFNYAVANIKEQNFTFLYDVSDIPSLNIINHVNEFQISCLIMGMSRRSKLIQMIRGNVINDIFKKLPPEVDLIIVS